MGDRYVKMHRNTSSNIIVEGLKGERGKGSSRRFSSRSLMHSFIMAA